MLEYHNFHGATHLVSCNLEVHLNESLRSLDCDFHEEDFQASNHNDKLLYYDKKSIALISC
jgi:hypothetical protein